MSSPAQTTANTINYHLQRDVLGIIKKCAGTNEYPTLILSALELGNFIYERTADGHSYQIAFNRLFSGKPGVSGPRLVRAFDSTKDFNGWFESEVMRILFKGNLTLSAKSHPAVYKMLYNFEKPRTFFHSKQFVLNNIDNRILIHKERHLNDSILKAPTKPGLIAYVPKWVPDWVTDTLGLNDPIPNLVENSVGVSEKIFLGSAALVIKRAGSTGIAQLIERRLASMDITGSLTDSLGWNRPREILVRGLNANSNPTSLILNSNPVVRKEIFNLYFDNHPKYKPIRSVIPKNVSLTDLADEFGIGPEVAIQCLSEPNRVGVPLTVYQFYRKLKDKYPELPVKEFLLKNYRKDKYPALEIGGVPISTAQLSGLTSLPILNLQELIDRGHFSSETLAKLEEQLGKEFKREVLAKWFSVRVSRHSELAPLSGNRIEEISRIGDVTQEQCALLLSDPTTVPDPKTQVTFFLKLKEKFPQLNLESYLNKMYRGPAAPALIHNGVPITERQFNALLGRDFSRTTYSDWFNSDINPLSVEQLKDIVKGAENINGLVQPTFVNDILETVYQKNPLFIDLRRAALTRLEVGSLAELAKKMELSPSETYTYLLKTRKDQKFIRELNTGFRKAERQADHAVDHPLSIIWQQSIPGGKLGLRFIAGKFGCDQAASLSTKLVTDYLRLVGSKFERDGHYQETVEQVAGLASEYFKNEANPNGANYRATVVRVKTGIEALMKSLSNEDQKVALKPVVAALRQDLFVRQFFTGPTEIGILQELVEKRSVSEGLAMNILEFNFRRLIRNSFSVGNITDSALDTTFATLVKNARQNAGKSQMSAPRFYRYTQLLLSNSKTKLPGHEMQELAAVRTALKKNRIIN